MKIYQRKLTALRSWLRKRTTTLNSSQYQPSSKFKMNGCFRHMTGDAKKFKEMKTICFGNNDKLKVLESGNIILSSNFVIKKTLCVENPKFNLLNISQLYDSRYRVEFKSNKCIVKSTKESNLTLLRVRNENVYTIDLSSSSSSLICLMPH